MDAQPKTTVIILLLIVAAGAVFILWPGSEETEDRWLVDERGVYVKHGNPTETPLEVTEQQQVIEEAKSMFASFGVSGSQVDSGPCLGVIDNKWAVDVVHEPRSDFDNEPINQCDQYRRGDVEHFIEISTNGEIVRIE